MTKVKVAIVGVGNCASSLVQGVSYYADKNRLASGLINQVIGGYGPSDIEFVLAIDTDARKVGKPLAEAIFAQPNCTTVFQSEIHDAGPTVIMGKALDGMADHMFSYPNGRGFEKAAETEATAEQITQALKDSGADVMINFLPVGSEEATKFYMQCALDAGVAVVNCMPVFIASNPEWEAKFRNAGVPIIGDDVKAQLGATIVHRVLTHLFKQRGVKMEHTYQLNTGGNTDFMNMLDRDRLKSKKTSKTEAVQSVMAERLDDDDIHVGPSDYVPWLNDNKLCFLRLEGLLFGDVPMNIEMRLSVEDSPNSAAVVIDAIRCVKIAAERGWAGAVYGPSSYFCKHPPRQINDDAAHQATLDFIENVENPIEKAAA